MSQISPSRNYLRHCFCFSWTWNRSALARCCQELLSVHGGYSHKRQYLEIILCFSKQRLNPTQRLTPGRIGIKDSLNDLHRWPLPNFNLALCRNKSSSDPAARFTSSSPLPPPPPSKADTRALCKPPTCSPRSQTSKGPRRAPPQLERRPLRAAGGAN